MERHKDSYAEAINFLEDVIADPDYIIKDKRKYTGLLIKKVKINDCYVQLVLRICTSEDEPGYKNSVISCWKISENRVQNYLQNKTIF